MPLKSGALTPKERAFLDAYAECQDREVAARKAKVSRMSSYLMLERPDVQRALALRQRAIVAGELAPLGLRVLRDLLTNDKTPAQTRFAAAKYVTEQASSYGVEQSDKDPSEMSAEELAERIARLEAAAADRAKEVRAASLEADRGVFD